VTVDGHKKYVQALPCVLTPAQDLLDGLRASKDEGELALMRRAQEITDEAFKAILSFIRPGMTEREIAARLVYELLSRGGEKVSFDPIVAAGPNGSRPHAVPGDQMVEEGIARTFQNIRLFKDLTVLDNVKVAFNQSMKYSVLGGILRLPGYWREEEEIDRKADEMMERLTTQMAQSEGVTESLKATDQMKWVGMMNNIRHSAEEIVLKELIYSL